MNALKNKTILIVDDEPLIREVIAGAFLYSECTILEADSGSHALTVLGANAVDAVISDFKMPGGNGIELLNAIQQGTGNKPIFIMMSGFCEYPSDELYKNGAVAFVAKPFLRKEILEVVRESLTEQVLV